jgi:hypothetical protein
MPSPRNRKRPADVAGGNVGTPLAGEGTRPPTEDNADDERPGLPGFRRWREVYLLVFVIFVLVVTALAIFSSVFA